MTSACSRRSSFVSLRVLGSFNFSVLVLGLILLNNAPAASLRLQEDKQVQHLSFGEEQAGSSPSRVDGVGANQNFRSQVTATMIGALVQAAVMKESVPISRKLIVKSRRQERLVSALEAPVYTRLAPSSTTNADSKNTAMHHRSPNQQNGLEMHRVQAETQKMASTQKPLPGDNADDSGAFHVDYSGPRTHPPKNN